MRDKLMEEIMLALISSGIEDDMIKSKLTLILNNYEVQERCTEVAVVSEDDVAKYIRLFLVNKRVAGRTERTIENYGNTLNRFFREAQKSPLDITSDDIKFYLATKEVRDGVGKVYQKHISRVLSSFYQWMCREEYILKNPMNKVDDIKLPKVKKEAFTETQVEQLRFAIGDDLRVMCMFEMLLSTWCRVSELAQIKISELSEDRTTVLVHGKGSKDRICYINARAKLCLLGYLSKRQDNNEYLFAESNYRIGSSGEKAIAVRCEKAKIKPREWWTEKELVGKGHVDKANIEIQLRRLGRRAGVEKVHPHRFRRTGATFALRRGMPIEQVSKLLGHESIETTQIYLDISEQEIEQAHRRYV